MDTSQSCSKFLIIAVIIGLTIESCCFTANASRLPAVLEDFFHADSGTTTETFKRWAVLVAGSNGWENYRHQADICHAYQILKRNGLSDENIIVFMYDDIANNENNPKPGVIINKPNGNDVYKGVPKDYTGDNANSKNLYAVILGNKAAVKGGSRKVVNSGPNDHIFIYYADHGAAGLIAMPGNGDYVYAKDLMAVLKKKNAAKAYGKMVVYIEACESGSMFEGLLPKNINIYATTASTADENSYATYCPDESSDLRGGLDTCLGDLYSISWMEDCDKNDVHKETLGQQYEAVRSRTGNGTNTYSSHVMQYGNASLREELLSAFMASNVRSHKSTSTGEISSPSVSGVVDQRDADLLHFKNKFNSAPRGSQEKLKAKKQLDDEISQREHVDYSINQIGKLLFGQKKSSKVLNNVRSPGQAVVDDWDCLKKLVRAYEDHCGFLSAYGMKYGRAIANMCNAGVTEQQMVAASMKTCT